MPRRAKITESLPPPALRAIHQLGQDLEVARRRRRISQQLMADRMLVNRETVIRLERGDPTVSLSVLASALFVLGLTGRLEKLSWASERRRRHVGRSTASAQARARATQ